MYEPTQVNSVSAHYLRDKLPAVLKLEVNPKTVSGNKHLKNVTLHYLYPSKLFVSVFTAANNL